MNRHQTALCAAAMSKMPSKKKIPKRKGHIRPAQEKRDDDIMGVSIQHQIHCPTLRCLQTNDSSIVSKRSVCSLYFPDEPDYYAPFVGKHVRRNPLINRGYWLRMHAIEQVVRHFLEADNDKTKVVVNLGCG
jgi:tRNA wybutosine-synthesizing protein 4